MHDFQSRFPENDHFSNFKIYLLLHFKAIIVKHSGYFLSIIIKKMIEPNFFRLLNSSYWILKILSTKKSSKNRLLNRLKLFQYSLITKYWLTKQVSIILVSISCSYFSLRRMDFIQRFTRPCKINSPSKFHGLQP